MMIAKSCRVKCFRSSVGLMMVLAVAAWASQAHAVLVVVVGWQHPNPPSSTATPGGGTFINPSGQSVTGDYSGFSVSGDFSVQADGTQSDVTVNITADYLFQNVPAGSYITTASMDGFFSSSLGSSSNAWVKQYENDTYLLSGSTLVGGSQAFAGGDFSSTETDNIPFWNAIHLSNSPEILSGGTSQFFSLGFGDYTLEQKTTIVITGVGVEENLSILLPNGSTLSTPVPASITMLGTGFVMLAGAVAFRRLRLASVA